MKIKAFFEKNEGKTETKGEVAGNNIKCYPCGMAGHISKQCNHVNAVCYFCKQEDHVATRCPKRTAEGGSQQRRIGCPVQNVKTLTVPAAKDSGEKFVHDVVLDGRHILKGFLDTGSSVCTV